MGTPQEMGHGANRSEEGSVMAAKKPVALVTGAARRLGREISLGLARAGYAVAVHYRSSQDEAESLVAAIGSGHGVGSAAAFRADLDDPASCAKLVSGVAEKFGGLDLLVNNASMFRKTPLENVTADDMQNFMSVHVMAPAVLSMKAAPLLRKGAPGRIINMLDIFASYPRKGFTPYTVSKAGLMALTRQLALELAPGVLVNGVAPGAILEPEAGFDESVVESLRKRIPLGRFGEADDIVRTVLFLAGSCYITGQTIVVDGGRSINL